MRCAGLTVGEIRVAPSQIQSVEARGMFSPEGWRVGAGPARACEFCGSFESCRSWSMVWLSLDPTWYRNEMDWVGWAPNPFLHQIGQGRTRMNIHVPPPR